MSHQSPRDPLYLIFEQHLYDFNDETDTEDAFVEKVVTDYLRFLQVTGSIINHKLKKLISEELKDQVSCMLKKRVLGSSNPAEFTDPIVKKNRRRSPKSPQSKK